MIIGLTGKMGAGKDTVADYLVSKHGFKKVGFSDELYAGVCALWGIDLETALRWKSEDKQAVIIDKQFPMTTVTTPMTWREFLQRFGTEMGRQTWGKDFWVNRFEDKYLDASENLVVRDVRFNNEAFLLGKYGGTIWEVQRPGYEGDDHESEAGIDERHIDGELINDSTIEELHKMLDWWMEELNA